MQLEAATMAKQRLAQECVKLYFALYAESIFIVGFDKDFFVCPYRASEREKMLMVMVLLCARVLMKIFLFFHFAFFLKIAIKWIMIMKATKQAQIYVRLPQIFTIISKLLFAIVNDENIVYAKLLS